LNVVYFDLALPEYYSSAPMRLLPSFTVFTFLCFVFFIPPAYAQNLAEKVNFDKSGKYTTEAAAYYYRVPLDGSGNYKSFYTNGGAVYFEGKLAKADNDDENKNKYEGVCKWYYKNGKQLALRTFNASNQEDGVSTYYYESGKIQKEIEFKNGQIVNNRYKEFDESGVSNRIFVEEFSNNNNDWDLYISDKSASQLVKGSLELTSFTNEGTSRFISIPIESSDYSIEAEINIASLKDGDKAGIIYGYKDWQNFHYFFITQGSFYIGTMYEGVSDVKSDGMFSSAVVKKSKNVLKVLTNNDRLIFSVNGEIQFSKELSRNFGSYSGVTVSGKSAIAINRFVVKEMEVKSAGGNTNATSSDIEVKATGTGVVFAKDGYIMTNHHVIDNANKIVIEFTAGGTSATYNAVVVQKDKDNDLAILKIQDPAFKPFDVIPFSFKDGGVDVGAEVFTIGFPYALGGMGKEVKFTDGKVSAKTGYNNAVNSFQTSIPVQPGNSGGPVFTDKAQLAGLINSSIRSADNVSYAIKLNYVKNLIELMSESVPSPADQSLAALPLEEKLKVLSKYVVLIKIK
jgi:S1-C subfamily serine protease